MNKILIWAILDLVCQVATASALMRPVAKTALDADGKNRWMELHEKRLAEIAAAGGSYDFVLIGDSITYNWRHEKANGKWGERPLGKPIADKEFAGKKWLNLGVGGDGIRQVLWRCLNGELDGYRTPVIGVLVGTNNHESPDDDIVLGIAHLLGVIRAKHLESKILLQPVLPRMQKPDDKDDLRKKFDRVNARLRLLADGEVIVWLDWTSKLLRPDGSVNDELMLDAVHPAGGYVEWAKALKPYLK